jgi:hypothetical protein
LGLRDEDNPDPDDIALRFFVADFFPFPTVIIQRVFDVSQAVTLPDTAAVRARWKAASRPRRDGSRRVHPGSSSARSGQL